MGMLGTRLQSTNPYTVSPPKIDPAQLSPPRGPAEATERPIAPLASSSSARGPAPTNLGALVATGLKVGVAALGVMIGAAGLTGCATQGTSYQGPSYAEIHRATLTWEAPTANTDGTRFHDENGDGRIDGVRGYIVFRGSAPRAPGGDYAEARELTRPDCKSRGGRTLCTYAWENLPSGTHYFSVKAWKEVTPGERSVSDFSNEASKTIP